MSCISAHDPQLVRLADAIAQRVGQQRFHVWFNNSTRLDLKQDGLEIAVPNDFISEWIGTHFSKPIQEAAHEILGCPLAVRFNVMPQLFEVVGAAEATPKDQAQAKAIRGPIGYVAPIVGANVPAKAVMQNVRPTGLSIPTVKYVDIDTAMRTRLRAEWNQPVRWPLAVLAVVVVLLVIPAVRTYRRERR